MEENTQRQRLEMQDSEAITFCPSFNSYSSDKFAEIADKVTKESIRDHDDERPVSNELDDDDDDDFEFSLVRGDSDVTADQIFGQVRQVFPIFNRDLLIRDDQDRDAKPDVSTLRLPLKKLFIEDRDDRDSVSSCSSEADELEGVPSGTYCVWRPKEVEGSPSRCKKSNSTGSVSKRWKLRDLIRRSNSAGKDAFVFLTPKNTEHKAEKIEHVEKSKEKRNSGDAVKLKTKGGEKVSPSSSAHEAFYVRNRASKEGDKRKSYLPYRQDLVGFFANVNGMGKSFPPF